MNGLIKNLDNLPFSKQTVNIVGGYYDLLHYGHLEFLQECKNKSDAPLLVLLKSDADCKSKNPERPIIPEEGRALVLLGLECVDYVIIVNNANPDIHTIYKTIDPKKVFFSSGESNSERKRKEMEIIKSKFPNIELILIPRQTAKISTTKIISKIKRLLVKHPEREKVVLRNTKSVKEFLELTASNSTENTKTATAIVDNDTRKVLATGYNSRPIITGSVIHKNKKTFEFQKKSPRPIHSETKAIIEYIKSGYGDPEKVTLYTLTEPCAGCSQIILQFGFKKVSYFKDFDNNYGSLLLKESGVQIKKLK